MAAFVLTTTPGLERVLERDLRERLAQGGGGGGRLDRANSSNGRVAVEVDAAWATQVRSVWGCAWASPASSRVRPFAPPGADAAV